MNSSISSSLDLLAIGMGVCGICVFVWLDGHPTSQMVEQVNFTSNDGSFDEKRLGNYGSLDQSRSTQEEGSSCLGVSCLQRNLGSNMSFGNHESKKRMSRNLFTHERYCDEEDDTLLERHHDEVCKF